MSLETMLNHSEGEKRMERYNRGASVEERPANKPPGGQGRAAQDGSHMADLETPFQIAADAVKSSRDGVSMWKKKKELNYYLICLTIFRGVLQIFWKI